MQFSLHPREHVNAFAPPAAFIKVRRALVATNENFPTASLSGRDAVPGFSTTQMLCGTLSDSSFPSTNCLSFGPWEVSGKRLRL